ncbi:MAG: FHA domain-containing protein, partial [Mycobacteriales bacterium]
MKLRLSIQGRRIEVDAPPQTGLRDIAARLRSIANTATDTQLYTDHGPLWLDGTFGDGQLRHGCVVGVGSSVSVTQSIARPRLTVIGGADAGRAVALRPHATTVGRGSDCDLKLDDPDVSRRHALIACDAAGSWVTYLGSTNGTSLAGRPPDECPVRLEPREPFRCGNSVLWIDDPEGETLPVHRGTDGRFEVRRPPRFWELTPPRTFRYPTPPTPPGPGEMPLT